METLENESISDTYDQVPNDNSGQEEGDTDLAGHPHAVPHRLNPLPAEHPEHDHEAVHEVNEVPTRHLFARKSIHIVWNKEKRWSKMQSKFVHTCVAFPKELHTHNSKNEDDNTEDKGKVTKSTNSFPHDGDE